MTRIRTILVPTDFSEPAAAAWRYAQVLARRFKSRVSAKHVDLVVMGTHGRGVVGHLLLGSVAERVVQRSPVPVMTVHGPQPAARRRKRS